MKKLFAFVFIAALTSGCASNLPNNYQYWGNYSKTLYEYKKNPGPETLAAHKQELQNILQLCDENHWVVPPGIHAELGEIILKEGDKTAAIEQFAAETKLYPEANVLMTQMLKKAG